MVRLTKLALLFCTLLLVLSSPAQARRVALIIGNSAYQNVTALPNPSNDAKALAAAFQRLAFDDVKLFVDLDNTGLRRALQAFASTAAGADVAVVYFAGHGVEVDGRNYIIPVDATLAQKSDTEFEAIPLESLRSSVAGATALRMVILDACRNNPFKLAGTDGKRSIGRGLAKVEPEGNELVAYAAREGTTANDGDGANSPFATALLKHMEAPSLDIRLMFGLVRDDVKKVTGNQQEPFMYGSLGGQPVYLNVQVAVTAKAAATADAPVPAPADGAGQLGEAAAAWTAVKDTTSVGVLKRYIERYKGTVFADLASARLEELGGPEPVAGNGQDQVAINTPDSGPPPAAVTIEPYVIPVGKWAEGVTVSNGSLWVAESGSRSVAEVDAASGKIRRHITVGRLPVSMGSAPDGSVYVLVETDKAVWVQPPGGGKGRRLATLVDCPQAMAVSDAAVWVLTQPDCSSADSRMVKIDRHGAGEAITESLGEWGQAMTLGHGKAWGAHARGPGISMVDLKTLAFQRVGSGELSFWAITSNSFGIYAGGHQGQDNSAGVIAEINPIDGKEGRRILVPERIAAMTSDDRNVIAVGDKGTIWVVDAGRFAIVKTIKVGGGLGNPRDVILQDGRIVMTDQSRNGDNGALVIIQNWQ